MKKLVLAVLIVLGLGVAIAPAIVYAQNGGANEKDDPKKCTDC